MTNSSPYAGSDLPEIAEMLSARLDYILATYSLDCAVHSWIQALQVRNWNIDSAERYRQTLNENSPPYRMAEHLQTESAAAFIKYAKAYGAGCGKFRYLPVTKRYPQ